MTLPFAINKPLKWLSSLPILTEHHYGTDTVALGIMSPSSPTSWDLGPRQYLSGDIAALNKSNEQMNVVNKRAKVISHITNCSSRLQEYSLDDHVHGKARKDNDKQ